LSGERGQCEVQKSKAEFLREHVEMKINI
jgi:hypothetical protein